MTKKTAFSYGINLLAVLVLFFVLLLLNKQGIINKYVLGILTLICINIILAVSLNVTTGCLGQIALGHAGFMSAGAYTAAIFTQAGIIPGVGGYFAGLLLGGLVAAIIGIIIGLPALRLRGDYLAIITLAFGEIIRVVIENMTITGGAQGLKGIKKLSAYDISLFGMNADFTAFAIVFFLMVLSVVLMYTMMVSRHGRAILAIREDDIASEAAGVNNTYYRTLAFTVSAFFAGIAGGMYAHYIGILGAKSFDFNKSIEILITVVLGGLGSFTGSVVSAIALTSLPELLRQFSDYRMLVYSIVLILVMIFKPSGLMGTKEFSLSRLFFGRKKVSSEKGSDTQ